MLALYVLRDQAALRRTAAGLTAAGAIAAVTVGLGARQWPQLGVLLEGLPLGLGAAALLTQGLATRTWGERVLGTLALVLLTAIASTAWSWESGVRLSQLPLLGAQGAAVGLALLLGLLPGNLVRRPLRLWWAARGARAAADEHPALLLRGAQLWQRVELAGPDREVRVALERGLLRLFGVAQRYTEVVHPAAIPAPAMLAAAQTALAEKHSESGDPIASASYAEAHRSIGLQIQHVRTITANRERLLAHLHRHLETMEALSLATITARCVAADQGIEDVRPILEELGRLGDEIDANREVLG